MDTHVSISQRDPAPRDRAGRDRDFVEGLDLLNRLVSTGTELREPERASQIERRLAALAASLAPTATRASISVIFAGHLRPHTLDGGIPGESVLDEAQYESEQGPLMEVLAGDAVEVSTTDVCLDPRWPGLVATLRDGVVASRSLVSRSLVVPDDCLACLNLYGEPGSGVVSARDVHSAAAAVGVGLCLFLQRRRADNLGYALDSNRLIGAALGVLIVRYHWTYDGAFERLRSCSQRSHRKLHDLAGEVVATGVLPGLLDLDVAGP